MRVGNRLVEIAHADEYDRPAAHRHVARRGPPGALPRANPPWELPRPRTLLRAGTVMQQFGHGDELELLPPARACEISSVWFLGGTHSSRSWIPAARVEWLATIGP